MADDDKTVETGKASREVTEIGALEDEYAEKVDAEKNDPPDPPHE